MAKIISPKTIQSAYEQKKKEPHTYKLPYIYMYTLGFGLPQSTRTQMKFKQVLPLAFLNIKWHSTIMKTLKAG